MILVPKQLVYKAVNMVKRATNIKYSFWELTIPPLAKIIIKQHSITRYKTCVDKYKAQTYFLVTKVMVCSYKLIVFRVVVRLRQLQV